MKRLEDFLKSSCTYTVVILAFFYIFAATNNFGDHGISFGRFALITLFGAVVAAAEYLFLLKVNKLVSVALHYCVLLFAFSMIFVVSGVVGGAESKIFVALIVFTLFYAIIFLAFYFAKRGLAGLDSRLNKKMPQKKTVKPEKKGEYQPRFKG